MQYENLISTKILCDSVVKHRNQKKGEFTHSFMEETARKLHEAWRNRNVLKAKAAGDAEKKKDDSQIPYKKLSDPGSHHDPTYIRTRRSDLCAHLFTQLFACVQKKRKFEILSAMQYSPRRADLASQQKASHESR